MKYDEGNKTTEFQDFFTPRELAEELLREVEKVMELDGALVLEPAMGSGNLVKPILKKYNVRVLGIELQRQYVDKVRKDFSDVWVEQEELGIKLPRQKYGEQGRLFD